MNTTRELPILHSVPGRCALPASQPEERRGLSLVRRNGEYHHFDVTGAAGVITGAGGAVLSSDLFDAFGVRRYVQGQAATPWRWDGMKLGEEGMTVAGDPYLPDRALRPQQSMTRRPREDCQAAYDACVRRMQRWWERCEEFRRSVCVGFFPAIYGCTKWCKGIPKCIAACVVAAGTICVGSYLYCEHMARWKEGQCLKEKAACDERNRQAGYAAAPGAARLREVVS